MSTDTMKPRGRAARKGHQQLAAIREQRCRDFNRQCPIGAGVEYYAITGETEIFKTISAAYVLNGHAPVVNLEGKSLPVPLDAVKVIQG